MSAIQTFAFCIDCWAIHYGISDSNGVYTRDSASSEHWDHAVHVFRDPGDYPPPIRGVLRSLHRGELISDGRMELFSLALAVTAIQPNNGVKPDGPRAQAAPGFVPGRHPTHGTLSGALLEKAGRVEGADHIDGQDALPIEVTT